MSNKTAINLAQLMLMAGIIYAAIIGGHDGAVLLFVVLLFFTCTCTVED